MLVALVVAACLLAAGRLAQAQSEGKITVTSPDSEALNAGESIVVVFNASGDAIYGPYDIDLLKGNNEVQNWCSDLVGCDIPSVAVDGYGTLVVSLSSAHEPDLGYTVRVADRNSSISGSSFPFEVLAALPSNSSEEASPEYRDEVGGAGGVGDMGLAMLVVASVCGLALACALLVACFIMCRRRSTKKIKDLESTEDVELGGSLDRTTPGRMNDSSSSDSRGFSSGPPVMAQTPGRIARGDSNGHIYGTPGRAMAKGEHQRGRSLSRAKSGPQMYSTTPGRRRASSASPARPGSRHGYDSTPGQGGELVVITPGRRGGSRHGRQMYDSSGGPSWDEARGRLPSRSPGLPRPKSTGRIRRPPRSASQEFPGDYVRGNSGIGLATMTPGRRRSSGGDSDSRVYGHQDSYGPRHGMPEHYEYSPSHHWTREEDEQRWEDRGVMEGGRRSRSSSARSRSPSLRSLERSASGRSMGRSTTPSRQRGYNSGMPAVDGVEMPPDVSWEELRSTYLRNKTMKSRSGVRKSYSLPSYGDAVGDNRPPPPSYSPNDAGDNNNNPMGLSIGAEAEADAELLGDDSYGEAEVHMSPSSEPASGGGRGGRGGGGVDGETSCSSVREKIKVFSGGNSLGSSGSINAEKTPGRSPFSGAPSRGWSRADENEIKARAEQSSSNAKEALASFGRSISGGGRPDNSWVKEGVRGPDTAGGSSHDAKAAATTSLEPVARVGDAELLAMKRKAFVKQYSQSGASDVNDVSDSEYSLHDNAAAVAIAAIVGKQGTTAMSNGNDRGQAYEEPEREEYSDGMAPGTPKRGRSTIPVDLDGSGDDYDDERTRVRTRRSPEPSYTVTKEVHIHTVQDPSILTMSDSGSPRVDL
eukprot:g1265.t1